MRRMLGCALSLAALGAIVMWPSGARAQERASLEGFGGPALNALQPTSSSTSLGGTVTFSVVSAVQIVGEAGRLGNVLPAVPDAVFSAAGAGLRAGADGPVVCCYALRGGDRRHGAARRAERSARSRGERSGVGLRF